MISSIFHLLYDSVSFQDHVWSQCLCLSHIDFRVHQCKQQNDSSQGNLVLPNTTDAEILLDWMIPWLSIKPGWFLDISWKLQGLSKKTHPWRPQDYGWRLFQMLSITFLLVRRTHLPIFIPFIDGFPQIMDQNMDHLSKTKSIADMYCSVCIRILYSKIFNNIH